MWRQELGAEDSVDALQVNSKCKTSIRSEPYHHHFTVSTSARTASITDVVTVSGGGRFLRSWSVIDGAMAWDATVLPPVNASRPEALELHLLPVSRGTNRPVPCHGRRGECSNMEGGWGGLGQVGKEAAGVQDILILSQGVVYRFSGTNGALLWQAQADASR